MIFILTFELNVRNWTYDAFPCPDPGDEEPFCSNLEPSAKADLLQAEEKAEQRPREQGRMERGGGRGHAHLSHYRGNKVFP